MTDKKSYEMPGRADDSFGDGVEAVAGWGLVGGEDLTIFSDGSLRKALKHYVYIYIYMNIYIYISISI